MSNHPNVDEIREALRIGIVTFLTAGGYSNVKDTGGLDDILFQFFNVQKRSLRPTPRSVERAKGYDWGAHASAVNVIEREFEAGEDMTPRLSRKLAVKKSAAASDDLLNDWRLQHLHLATRALDGSVPGGPVVLVAWVDDTRALFLGVIGHNDWGRQDLFDQLSQNWPDVVEPFRLSGALDSPNLSNDDRMRLRDSGVNALTAGPGGAAFAPIGGGITMSGHSVEATRRMHEVMRVLRKHSGDLATLASHLTALGLEVVITSSPLTFTVQGVWSGRP